MFGQSSQTTGIFGNSATAAPATTTPGGFGHQRNTASLFTPATGTTSTAPFSFNASAPTTSAPASATSLFGSTATNANQGTSLVLVLQLLSNHSNSNSSLKRNHFLVPLLIKLIKALLSALEMQQHKHSNPNNKKLFLALIQQQRNSSHHFLVRHNSNSSSNNRDRHFLVCKPRFQIPTCHTSLSDLMGSIVLHFHQTFS
ncbi:unnamed protein product [Absidia cylindrospora]